MSESMSEEQVHQYAWWPQKKYAAYLIHAWCTPYDGGEVYSVDFECFKVTGWQGLNGEHPCLEEYNHVTRTAPSTSAIPPAIFQGFCKWDGCMQWEVTGEPLQLHVDSASSILEMGGALLAARTLSSMLCNNWDCDDEPQMPFELTDDTPEMSVAQVGR